jgi:hypothetical protein
MLELLLMLSRDLARVEGLDDLLSWPIKLWVSSGGTG